MSIISLQSLIAYLQEIGENAYRDFYEIKSICMFSKTFVKIVLKSFIILQWKKHFSKNFNSLLCSITRLRHDKAI